MKKLIVSLGGFGGESSNMSEISTKLCASHAQIPGHGSEAYSYFYSQLLSLIMVTISSPIHENAIILLVLLSIFCMLVYETPISNDRSL